AILTSITTIISTGTTLTTVTATRVTAARVTDPDRVIVPDKAVVSGNITHHTAVMLLTEIEEPPINLGVGLRAIVVKVIAARVIVRAVDKVSPVIGRAAAAPVIGRVQAQAIGQEEVLVIDLAVAPGIDQVAARGIAPAAVQVLAPVVAVLVHVPAVE